MSITSIIYSQYRIVCDLYYIRRKPRFTYSLFEYGSTSK